MLPDIDLLYFYLVDGRQTVHHAYWTHIPAFWAAVLAVPTAIASFAQWLRIHVLAAGINIFLHLVLDSIAAEIYWLLPYSDARVNLVEVPARYDWWVVSFVLHWTFTLELLVTGTALWLFLRKRPQPESVGSPESP